MTKDGTECGSIGGWSIWSRIQEALNEVKEVVRSSTVKKSIPYVVVPNPESSPVTHAFPRFDLAMNEGPWKHP